jgi:tRNA threonylcarbamoyladenosine modification (KEOPS) complex  Pcc1 subunit
MTRQAQDSVLLRAVVNTMMNLASIKARNFSTLYATISFSVSL